MSRFNLSVWALRRRELTGFLLCLLLLGGCLAYTQLGQHEDPDFTIRMMVVRTLYPGAGAAEVELQLTDRLEKKLQELPQLDFIRSYSMDGESVIFVSLREDSRRADVEGLWYQVRKRLADIRHTLPAGALGPFFNDDFGDTYTAIYALSGDGFSYAELKRQADLARLILLRLPNVRKVDLFGEQAEKIYLEFSDRKLAEMKLDPRQVAAELQAQNALTPAGGIDGMHDSLPLRVNGAFRSLAEVQNIRLRVNDRDLRLGDLARVYRGYADPPQFKMRYQGRDAVGVGVIMRKHGDVLALGRELAAAARDIERELPAGVLLDQVANQARVVKYLVNDFLHTFLEALAVVLAVSVLSLGVRASAIVALVVPLVLAATLLFMWALGIEIHRVSLGALILGLGLLVDDAIIAIEIMARKLDEGWEKMQAATHAYQITAVPMLTGTLISIAGFLPVGLARSQSGEYTEAIFQVTGISLLASWVCAVIFTPYLGYLILPVHPSGRRHDGFDSPFYRRLRLWVDWCLRYRGRVIAATGLMFALGVWALLVTPKQFFPASNRPEFLVDLWLPEQSAFTETEAAARRLEAVLARDPDVVNYTAYIGGGTPRFFMLITQHLFHRNLAEFVVLTPDSEARERVMHRLRRVLDDEFPNLRGRCLRLSVGPPVEYPLLFRVIGPDAGRVREIVEQVKDVMRRHPAVLDVNDDWSQRRPVARLELDQSRVRALGVSSQGVSAALQAHYSGMPLAQWRDGDQLIDIVWRAAAEERGAAENLPNILLPSASGAALPLAQIAKIRIDFEDSLRWRRNGLPTISARADVKDGYQPPDVAAEIDAGLRDIRNSLPLGYAVEVGAEKEDNDNAQASILVWIPLVVAVTLVLLMLHLHNLSRTCLVFLTAPLGVIGAGFALLLFRMSFGFVALLGIIALAGIIMRNSVILVAQIEQDEKDGLPTWQAIVESTVRRFRPIVLTAAAAILAMIPLSFNDFFGPQAVVIMGGLTVATLLTVFFLPALYAAWFRVPPPANRDKRQD